MCNGNAVVIEMCIKRAVAGVLAWFERCVMEAESNEERNRTGPRHEKNRFRNNVDEHVAKAFRGRVLSITRQSAGSAHSPGISWGKVS